MRDEAGGDRGVTCPACGSERVRRGGNRIWTVYMAVIAAAVAAVLIAHLNAALVGGIAIAIIILAHLAFNERVCLDCGNQWRANT